MPPPREPRQGVELHESQPLWPWVRPVFGRKRDDLRQPANHLAHGPAIPAMLLKARAVVVTGEAQAPQRPKPERPPRISVGRMVIGHGGDGHPVLSQAFLARGCGRSWCWRLLVQMADPYHGSGSR